MSPGDLSVPTKVLLWPGDKTLYEYLDAKWPETWEMCITDPEVSWCGEKLNWAFRRWPEEKAYGFLADDTVVQTGDLVQALLEEAGDQNVAWPDDGHHGERMPTHFFVGGGLARMVGWLAHPWFPQNGIDCAWLDLGKQLGILRYRGDHRLLHEHPGLGVKGIPIDDCYVRGGTMNQEAGWMFDHIWFPSPEREALLYRLKEKFCGKEI